MELILLFVTSSSPERFFFKTKKELPPVALFSQKKIAFHTVGFPLRLGLGHSSAIEDYFRTSNHNLILKFS
jgi:hypothetical protein